MTSNATTKATRNKKVLSIVGLSLLGLLVGLGFLAFFSARWYIHTYGQMGFNAVLYTITSDLGGVEPELMLAYGLSAVLPTALCTAAVLLLFFFPYKQRLVLHLFKKKLRLFPLRRWLAVILCCLMIPALLLQAAVDVELIAYVEGISQMSTFFQDQYHDPDTTQITFPEQKRNLV